MVLTRKAWRRGTEDFAKSVRTLCHSFKTELVKKFRENLKTQTCFSTACRPARPDSKRLTIPVVSQTDVHVTQAIAYVHIWYHQQKNHMQTSKDLLFLGGECKSLFPAEKSWRRKWLSTLMRMSLRKPSWKSSRHFVVLEFVLQNLQSWAPLEPG